jgi:hypothetical protein
MTLEVRRSGGFVIVQRTPNGRFEELLGLGGRQSPEADALD